MGQLSYWLERLEMNENKTEITEEQRNVAMIFMNHGAALEQSRIIQKLNDNSDKVTDAQSAIQLILGK